MTDKSKQRMNAMPLVEMQQRLEVIDPDDDWTGVTSGVTRRRLQNRLNQRAWRRRRLQKALSSTSQQDNVDEEDRGILIELGKKVTYNQNLRTKSSRGPGCRLELPAEQIKLKEFAVKAYNDYVLASPKPSALSMLIQLNVLNALSQNASALGITAESLYSEEAISPFNFKGPDFAPLWKSAPSHLQPTSLQIAKRHHPWIDLYPVPQMRDNFIRALGNIDEDELCADLFDVEETDKKPNLIVWGDPSDPRAWEASIPFLLKWGWLLRGCEALLETTNTWRRKRGEKILNFQRRSRS